MTDEQWNAFVACLLAVKEDKAGRDAISQDDPALPFFKGVAPEGHSQPWTFASY